MGKDLNGKELGVGLSQRKDGRYEGKYTDAFGKRKSIYGFKISEVRKQLSDAKYEISHKMYGDSNMTVDNFFNYWIENCKEKIVANNTSKNYRNRYNANIKGIIGFMKLKNVKPIHCQNILNQMYADGYAYSTTQLTRVTLHAIFKGAVDNEYIYRNPVNDSVKCIKCETPERRVLTVDEQKEFIEHCNESMYGYAYELILQTGMRAGEIGGLQWNDVDLENGVVHIRRTLLQDKKKGGFYFGAPKSKQSVRDIPLSVDARRILLKQKTQQAKLKIRNAQKWNTDKRWLDLVFTTTTGNPVGVSTLNDMANKIVKHINEERSVIMEEPTVFERVYMHAFRHTFATRCIEAGIRPKTLQNIMGHSTLSVTMDMYVHVLDEEKIKEIKKLEEYENGVVKVS